MTPPESITEQWLPISKFEGDYEISNKGRIRRVKSSGNNQFCDGHVRTLAKDRNGYLFTNIGWRKTKRLNVYPHREVAIAFLGACPTPNSTVNHKDGNKANNDLGNLEYATYSEQQHHAIRLGLRKRLGGIAQVKCKLTDADIPTIRQMLADGISCCEIARRYGMHNTTIHDIKTGKNWHHVS